MTFVRIKCDARFFGGGLDVRRTKGRRDRPSPMLDLVEPVLGRLAADNQPDDLLLRGTRGRPPTTATIRDATHGDGLVAQLGFDTLTRHGLRHTGVPLMAYAGSAILVLQKVLGHQSFETTKGYLHPDHRHLAEAARQANQVLSAAPTRRDRARHDGSTYGPPRNSPSDPSRRGRSIGLRGYWTTSWAPTGAPHGRRVPNTSIHLVIARIEQLDQPVTVNRNDEALV